MSYKILVNDQSIDITSYSVKRVKIDGRLLLTAIIPKENISAGDLDTLCSEIEANAPTIGIYDTDLEETVQTLTGFKLTPVFALSKDRTAWELSIENSSELEYQYGLLKQRADDLEKANASQALTIASQGETIEAQNETIHSQGTAIIAQASKILEQDEQISAQAKTIEEQNATITSQGEQINAQAEQISAQAEEMTLLNDTLLEMLMG